MSQSADSRDLRPTDPRRSDSTSPPRRGFGARWLVLLFVVALVGPCAIVQAPREVGRWKLAAALKHRDASQNAEAYAKLEAAQRWLPDNADLWMQRAAWRSEDGDHQQAVEDANRAVALAPGDLRIRMYRSQVLQHAGRRLEAVEDWKWINMRSTATGIPARHEALNGLAYAQAVAQTELDEALDNVNRALDLEPGQPAYLDTRGYILYLKGRYAEALPDMNTAVAGMERGLAVSARRGAQPVVGPQFRDFRPEQGVAVVRYHRALALLALGRPGEAEADLVRVREILGGEPDDSLF